MKHITGIFAAGFICALTLTSCLTNKISGTYVSVEDSVNLEAINFYTSSQKIVGNMRYFLTDDSLYFDLGLKISTVDKTEKTINLDEIRLLTEKGNQILFDSVLYRSGISGTPVENKAKRGSLKRDYQFTITGNQQSLCIQFTVKKDDLPTAILYNGKETIQIPSRDASGKPR